MMTSRLQHALQHIDDLPLHQQDALAHLIETLFTPTLSSEPMDAMRGLPEDFEEELMRRRQEAGPTPLADEQFREVFGEDT